MTLTYVSYLQSVNFIVIGNTLLVYFTDTLKMIVFWDIVPCSLGVDCHFRGVSCLHHHPVDRGGMLFSNVGLLQDYIAL
jgi:hypothetical protein